MVALLVILQQVVDRLLQYQMIVHLTVIVLNFSLLGGIRTVELIMEELRYIVYLEPPLDVTSIK